MTVHWEFSTFCKVIELNLLIDIWLYNCAKGMEEREKGTYQYSSALCHSHVEHRLYHSDLLSFRMFSGYGSLPNFCSFL